ncbi:putative enzyme related to lactoylglutathione lyase [Thalassovita gelatinovora]|uniref:Putative enzyme related to lactoylglutathione lyase n=1 Tax=Thalassovita gelatinovora TaxID=53501 RepID=A0A0P1FI69_THAGE|nr:VOC family protein [Thalassovita gelatinovora]QIZ82123.1 VOC family protein [Thalassovita gelatinovora]CUH67691.1 putative enzyme related to lactoylglutathione lyase [Thalassovita gelatinovora]SEP69267.1 hypothetical protein SAMN04488043_101106 [Thalassovita gelatinovora]
MDQRISLITLAVEDPDRSASFYDALGWHRQDTPEGIIVYDLLGQSLGLYPKADLARDMGLAPEDLGTGAMTLACNQRDRAGVDAVVAAARAAGARILKDPHEVFWGGYIAYFADPDGHIWEIAHNPFAPLRDDGAFRWQGYDGK